MTLTLTDTDDTLTLIRQLLLSLTDFDVCNCDTERERLKQTETARHPPTAPLLHWVHLAMDSIDMKDTSIEADIRKSLVKRQDPVMDPTPARTKKPWTIPQLFSDSLVFV